MEEIMARYLVIVESPAKVKTIKKFLCSDRIEWSRKRYAQEPDGYRY